MSHCYRRGEKEGGVMEDELSRIINEHELWDCEFSLAQARLAELMSNISEDTMFAGWLSDNEYNLWSAMLDPERYCGTGFHEYKREDVDLLKPLSDACGGWVVWDDDVMRPKFVPMAEWLPMYETWKSSRDAAIDSARGT